MIGNLIIPEIHKRILGPVLIILCMIFLNSVSADDIPGTVSTDLFDSSRSTIIIDDDTIIDPINVFRTSGGFEDGHTLMRDGGLGSISYINFDTQSEVTISGVRLFAHNDGPSYSYRRAMSHFKLLADIDSDRIFETVVVDIPVNIDYSLQPDNKATDPDDLDITILASGPVKAKNWRLEVTQGTNVIPFEGVRMVELDALEAIEIPSCSNAALISLLVLIPVILSVTSVIKGIRRFYLC